MTSRTLKIPAALLALALSSALVGSACSSGTGPLALRAPDRAQFEQDVYPVLLRDCAFTVSCHGSTKRFFQVAGPGRLRLMATTRPLDELTPAEVAYSYGRAASMIDAVTPQSSLLLRKPLEISAGGTGHEGVDSLGRDVYQSTTEPGYMALAKWVLATPAAMKAQP
jgi:hypothetical protein